MCGVAWLNKIRNDYLRDSLEVTQTYPGKIRANILRLFKRVVWKNNDGIVQNICHIRVVGN